MSKFPSDTADELSSAVPMTDFQQHAERSERDWTILKHNFSN